MANLKDINEVPVLDTLEGTEKVLLNVDGEAKQAEVGLIKPKCSGVYDLVIKIKEEENGVSGTILNEYDFNVIKEKLLNGEGMSVIGCMDYPVGDITILAYLNMPGVYMFVSKENAAALALDQECIVIQILQQNLSGEILIKADGTVLVQMR